MVYRYQHGALLNPVEAQAYEKQATAARAMLAALKSAEDYVQAFRDGDADICLTRLREAIAQAEAAGIGEK